MPYRREKLTFAISSPDEFLLLMYDGRQVLLKLIHQFDSSVVDVKVKVNLTSVIKYIVR